MNEKILSVAPMMDWTDTHCRYFMRLLDPNIKLYTEMITADALYHGDSDRFLKFHNSEHPIALQIDLTGSNCNLSSSGIGGLFALYSE